MKKKLKFKKSDLKKSDVVKHSSESRYHHFYGYIHGRKFVFTRGLKIKLAVFAITAVIAMVLTYFIGFRSVSQYPYDLELSRGQTVSSAARQLKKDNIIISQDFFKASILFFGGGVQAGNYQLPANVTIWQAAKMLSRGDIAATTVLMREGETIKQIKSGLNKNAFLIGGTECDSSVEQKLAEQAGIEYIDVCNLKDGDLFPDTYRVAKGTKRIDVLRMSKKKMQSIKIGWENSGRFLPKPLKSWNEVITLASIVQKETPKSEEMPIVASVYLNRLNKHMKLQADPTVVYIVTDKVGDMHGRPLFKNHLKVSSPYNTYVKFGLPPAPIANVGRDAIAAVLAPADTNYLFFVADGQGGHKFSDTYAQHQANQADWRKIKKALNSK